MRREAVCGLGDIEPLEVTDLLGSLVDKSLVQAEQAGDGLRYRLLETIRQFAAERLLETGTDEAAAVAEAHCDHFLSVAETAETYINGPDQPEWLARLDADEANLWRAAEHAAADPAGTARTLRFASALRRYWIARVVDGRAFALLAPVLERPDARADQAQYVAASVAAMAAARTIDLPLAREFGDRAVGLARELGDDRLLIEALWLSANFCYFACDPEIGVTIGIGGGRARPAARRRCAARVQPDGVLALRRRRRPGRVRGAIRRSGRLHSALGRFDHQVRAAQ